MHPTLDAILPPGRGPQFDRIAFFGGYFGCLELETTAHVIPRREHVARWGAALANNPRTRLLLRLPSALLDRGRTEDQRATDTGAFIEALTPLLKRERFGAVVATLPSDDYLYGPAEVRSLSYLARALSPAPLVLEARHRSWYETAAVDAIRGAGWSLGHLEGDERWDAPPKEHAATGSIGMLRLVHPGVAPPALIGQVARRARELESRFDVLFVVTDCGADVQLNVAAALEIKYVLNGERPVPAWPQIRAAVPRLSALCAIPEAPE
jgi:uncharacterized protein YecE (DUF72 family)